MDNVNVYKNFINVLNIHKKALIDWGGAMIDNKK